MGKTFLAVMFACLAAIAVAQDVVPVPKLTARVVDLTGTLSANERAAIDAKLAAFEQAKGSQVAVLLVPSIGSETIEEFAGRVTDAWQLGRKGVDDGVLFVIAKQDRKLRIHNGRGVQGTLTDALSKRIISDIVTPRFRAGDFAGGIDEGVDAIMKAIEGEQLPLPAQKARGKVDTLASYSDFIWFAFLVPVLAMILRGIFGRFFGAGIMSGITGLAGWLLVGSLAAAIIAAVIAFLITLFTNTTMPRGARSGGLGGFVPGGSIGGWSGDAGGGGGFSGGGGSFDGGGASGSW